MTSVEGLPAVREAPVRSALPAGLRLLCVGQGEPRWIGLTLQLDAFGCAAPYLKWLNRAADVLRVLRDETFDCVVLGLDLESDAAALIRGIRAGGGDDPIVVLRPVPDDRLWLELADDDVEFLVTAGGWDSPALATAVVRAIERTGLRRENQQLAAADRRRLVRERDEAEHLLQQQRLILEQLQHSAAVQREPAGTGPSSFSGRSHDLDQYYHELLRTYVIMGSGSLGPEISRLADLLCLAGIGPRETLELHLHRVEQLVQGLGNRSTRHVMARADLLALELMIHLAEGFQRRIGK